MTRLYAAEMSYLSHLTADKVIVDEVLIVEEIGYGLNKYANSMFSLF